MKNWRKLYERPLLWAILVSIALFCHLAEDLSIEQVFFCFALALCVWPICNSMVRNCRDYLFSLWCALALALFPYPVRKRRRKIPIYRIQLFRDHRTDGTYCYSYLSIYSAWLAMKHILANVRNSKYARGLFSFLLVDAPSIRRILINLGAMTRQQCLPPCRIGIGIAILFFPVSCLVPALSQSNYEKSAQ